MGYEIVTSLSSNRNKNTIKISSYSSNVYPKKAESWEFDSNKDNFDEKLKHLLDCYIDGDIQLNFSVKTHLAFALRMTLHLFRALVGKTVSRYDLYKTRSDFERYFESLSWNNEYKYSKEESIRRYNFINEEIRPRLYDFFIKLVNEEYDNRFKKVNTFNLCEIYKVMYKKRGYNYYVYNCYTPRKLKDLEDLLDIDDNHNVLVGDKVYTREELAVEVYGMAEEKAKMLRDTAKKLYNNERRIGG